MRDRVALGALLVVALAVLGGLWVQTTDLPADAAPEASFDAAADADADRLTVEHAGGEALPSGSIRVLVYEDRPVLPDRTVHGTVWETDAGAVVPGDRLELEDPRFEPGHRVVVRWFGDDGAVNLHESRFG